MTLFAGAAWAAPAAPDSGAPVFGNPLVLKRADPHVTLHSDGYYYYTATAPEYDRIELRRVRSLNELGKAKAEVVWRKHASGPMSYHIWAPEMHHIDGKWYIYFTAGRADAHWDIRLYVLENSAANPLEGQWIERGQLKTGWESFSLDATTFALDGKRYLSWTQVAPPPNEHGTNIYLAQMDTPLSIKGPVALLSRPEYGWEKVKHAVNEAPSVLVRNGRVFLTYSASATDANYALGMLTAKADANLLDAASWRKSPVPVFKSSEANGQYGPGHNSFTTTPDGKTDILVYHARDYRDIVGDSLLDQNRHTRAQVINWRADGTPDFGEPVADRGQAASKPLFRDPVEDGAADPVVVWNAERGRWWMFYTNRRAKTQGLPGVSWVHGTRLGIAESADGGASWTYSGVADIALPPELGGKDATHWAPEIIRGDDGVYHMYLTVVPGVYTDWDHPRHMVHLTSRDLRNWGGAKLVKLASERVIDACVARLPNGLWRMWYNNEADKKSIYYADSANLTDWTDRGRAVADQGGEGPKVFQWRGLWWMITDVWQGLAVYKSSDAVNWQRQAGNLLQAPGQGEDDQVIGGHADVVVSGGRAWLFYFTHPGRRGEQAKLDGPEQRRSSIQVVELTESGGWLRAERDATTLVRLKGDAPAMTSRLPD
ncbi:family 43 glycosylhydrolase [Pseudoduganella namucuonensis]|uniref:Beta-xylosidase, GH43 family n=1 Tax=Pseudoduganella namucuonensis TaxID=1035707 RepID=A0A1I7K2B2_9BURK|nr:family 43 glycosylhydrolase [Pseudoduganella namucuonensis]SFU91574.1 Beta-xylosidase, GH43 family [Pseudoduganella namucuonensis]